jgi:hypothetical protein
MHPNAIRGVKMFHIRAPRRCSKFGGCQNPSRIQAASSDLGDGIVTSLCARPAWAPGSTRSSRLHVYCRVVRRWIAPCRLMGGESRRHGGIPGDL